MDWPQLAVFTFTMIGVMLWFRSESRSDNRRLEDLIASIAKDMKDEMKDFHGRLCTLEERYLQIITRRE
jgi:hypothetical protein